MITHTLFARKRGCNKTALRKASVHESVQMPFFLTNSVENSNSVFKRLIEIPTRPGNFMLCEELILHFVSKLFVKYTIREKSVMRITRNADIDEADVYDEDLDYRDIMEHLIKQRTRLNPVRLELRLN